MEPSTSMVVVCSGGLDSVTLLYKTMREHKVTSVVSFNYGQRHNKELEFAKYHAEQFDLKHHVIDLSKSGLTEALAQSGSSLISDETVPEGHYAEENMKSTVVPNRNMIMLSIALGIAVAEGANAVATGVHAGDHFIYPDCRPAFIGAAALAGYIGNEDFGNLWRAPIWAPFVKKSKADIAYEAFMLGVPIEETWSCYQGGEKHCGRCGTCVERLEAIAEAQERIFNEIGVNSITTDRTEYADSYYWREVIANKEK
jgi:7-cyano-7-deazaguanine synthase